MPVSSSIPHIEIDLNQARRLQTDTLGTILDIVKEHGDIVKAKVGFWDVYLLNDPAWVEHILLNNWRNYSRSTFQFANFSIVTGQGLLTTHGQAWQQDRRALQPAFHKRKVDGMAYQMVDAINQMHQRWDNHAKNGEPIDLDSEMLRLALDIVGRSLFSVDLTAGSKDLTQEILAMMRYVVYRSQNLLAPPLVIPTIRNLRFRRRFKRFNRLIESLISDRIASQTAKDDFLDLLLAMGDASVPAQRQKIRDQMITMLIAGYETVASGMNWIFHLLAHHIDWQEKVRDEICDLNLDREQQLVERFDQIQISKAVIDETFRLYPPSWLITRKPVEDDTFQDKTLSAGSLVVVSPYVLHRNPFFWYMPEIFDPNRFLSNAQFDYTKFSYIPFGGGPHLCIGKGIALTEATLTLGLTLSKYRLSDADSSIQPPDPKVTLRPSRTMRMSLERI